MRGKSINAISNVFSFRMSKVSGALLFKPVMDNERPAFEAQTSVTGTPIGIRDPQPPRSQLLTAAC